MTRTGPAIVVVGSANVDMIVRSERLPGPGETVVAGDFITAGGGKGANQAIAARRLGAKVTFVARLGADGPGRFALDSFKAEGLDLTALNVDSDAPTGVALILVDRDGQNMIAVASGANSRLTPADVRMAEPAIRNADVVIVQLEVPLETVSEALETAVQYGVTTVLNPAPARQVPERMLMLVDWLTPNEFEAAALTGVTVTDAASATTAGQILVDHGVGNVVITLGSHGAVHVTKSSTETIKPFSVVTIDTVGAGDAFTAALAVSLARGRSSVESLTYASAAGALATTRRGAQPALPTHAEVELLVATSAVPAEV